MSVTAAAVSLALLLGGLGGVGVGIGMLLEDDRRSIGTIGASLGAVFLAAAIVDAHLARNALAYALGLLVGGAS